MKKKGFTLIELLAVIVILAVLSLILTPVVLRIINNSREESRKESLKLYGSAVESAVLNEQMTQRKKVIGTFTTSDDGHTLTNPTTNIRVTVDFSKSKVVCESVVVEESGEIKLNSCTVGGSDKLYSYSTYDEEVKVVGEAEQEQEIALAPGLYDSNENLLASWDELVNTYGLDIEADYTFSNYTSSGSMYSVLNNNSNLSSGTIMIIPNGVTNIGAYSFYRCSGLTSITIPDGVISIGNNAFYRCSSLSSVTIPNGVTSIGRFAFSNCSSLSSITIPSSVTSIEDYVFDYCSGLTSIKVDSSNIVYEDRNSNAIIEKSTNKLILGCKNTVIPNGVTSIGEYSFYGCSGLTSITIPDSVTSIENGAFAGCSSLSSITISNSVTSIGRYAFSDCGSLTSITIPNSVTSIGGFAFENCSNLSSVTFNTPSGWKVGSTNLSSTDLSNTSTAATYLTTTYSNDHAWTRN